MFRTALLAVALLVSLVAAADSAFGGCSPKDDPGCENWAAVGVTDLGFCDVKTDPSCGH